MRWLVLPILLAVPAFAQWPSIDTPLPKQTGGEKDAALLISIEDYLLLPDVAGANENAVAWYQHLTKTRGVPASSVVFLKDSEATLEGIQDGLAKAVGLVKPGGLLWILYIGHGAPSEDGADGVLVGADAQQSTRQLYARSLPRSALLKALEGGKQARSIVFLDACFSGQSAAGEQLAKGAMPTLPEKERPLTMKSVVLLTAGTSRQFAGPLPGEPRPAFSYLALGGLRGWADEDGNGSVTAGELATFTNGVMRSTVNDRLQTPTLNPESAAGVVLGKSTQKESLPLGDIVLWLKGAAGGARTTLEPAPDVKATGPRVSRGAVKAVVGSLTVKTTPAGARLDLVDPSGKALATKAPLMKPDATPGRWKVTTSLEGYVAQTKDVDVPPDDVAFVEVVLQKPASLEVTGTPEGALVRVTGPDGFKDEGGLPWKAEGLTPGEYAVSISREGYTAESWTGTVAAAQAQRIATKLKRDAMSTTAQLSQCTGRQVPPIGYRQKTVLMPKGGPEAIEGARLEARRQLRENLCSGTDCEGLDQAIRDWILTEQDDKACATAVIEEADLKAWKSELTAARVDDQFRVVVRELFGAEKGQRIVVGNVMDDGSLGSPRALWVVRKMEHALGEAGITQVTPPEGWSGPVVPANATAALLGEVLSREEKGRKHVDVTWTAISPDGRSKTSTFTYISMPVSVASEGWSQSREGLTGAVASGPSQRVTTKIKRADEKEPGQQASNSTGTSRVDSRTGITWVWMPPGRFEQGCVPGDSECSSDEKPGTAKTVAGFWMAKTETTVKQFETCATQGRCGSAGVGTTGPRERADSNSKQGRVDHPLNCVHWYEAKAFCSWAGGRLPSATEWEYAAKSGQATIFPWGNSPPDGTRARFESNGTAPVGSFRAGDTKWGLSDVSGNLYEWTSTNYDAERKELRGGSWDSTASYLRTSLRFGARPTFWNNGYGFRCAQ